MSAAIPAIEERQIDGNYGEIYHNGHFQGDLRDFAGRLAIERREIPRAGTNGIVYRRGRIARDGTLRLGKVDSRWENYFIEYAAMSTEEKRRRRAQGIPILADAQLLIKLDDPDSWGSEEILLTSVKFWEVGIGYTQNDMLERNIPVTWQGEVMVKAIARPGNKQATGTLPAGDSFSPPLPSVTTWPAAGNPDGDPVI